MLTNKHVVITGGTGSLGKVLVKRLLSNEMGLGPVSRVLPSLETLRTPLYLMP